MKTATLVLSLALLLNCWADEAVIAHEATLRTYPAKVVSVTDGDTVKVTIDLGFGIEMRDVPIRMVGVFAPERGQPGSFEATAKLKELLPVGSPVKLRPVLTTTGKEQMTFARYVGRLWRKDLDICEEMTRFLTKQNESSSSPSTTPP